MLLNTVKYALVLEAKEDIGRLQIFLYELFAVICSPDRLPIRTDPFDDNMREVLR